MLTIRLSRIGKKNKPMFRLTVSEKAKDTFGDALEILGSYNPYNKELTANKERIDHWLSQGAQMSATVNNLLIEKSIIKGEKVKASKPKNKKKETEETKTEVKSPDKAPSTTDSPKTEESKPEEEKKEEAPKEEEKIEDSK